MTTLSQFPNIYRFITELPRSKKLFYGKVLLVSFVSGFLIMATFLKGFELVQSVHAVQTLDERRSDLVEQKTYWEQVISKHEGYRDAYFKLALLSYQLGDEKGMKIYLDKTLEIDPNFQEGRVFANSVSEE